MSYTPGIGGDPAQLAQLISSNIQKITQCSAEIQRTLNQLGTPQDSPELRQQLQQKQQYTNQLAKETDKYIKEFGSLPTTPSDQRQRKIQKDRLVAEFTTSLTNFQKAQRQAAEREKEFVARVRASSRVSGGFPEESSKERNLVSWESQTQPQVQVQDEEITEDDLRLIQERESSIRQLEADIMDINEIFKDLGMMIHEQGDVIGKPYSFGFMRQKEATCSLPVVTSQARVAPSSLSALLKSKVQCLRGINPKKIQIWTQMELGLRQQTMEAASGVRSTEYTGCPAAVSVSLTENTAPGRRCHWETCFSLNAKFKYFNLSIWVQSGKQPPDDVSIKCFNVGSQKLPPSVRRAGEGRCICSTTLGGSQELAQEAVRIWKHPGSSRHLSLQHRRSESQGTVTSCLGC
ncbi:syntaxin-7 [Delphinus delphis]|uniref:syntaxin-7 n=1 Tax=Delphinus delphis TaxID=9728 RepID=UPI0028C3D4AD|nr:syntaxin-7 [Delphinus delphis]